jgi:surfeit locus 1 family protein
MQRKGLVGFTLLMLLALAVLLGLGVWQIKRLHWKEGLIAQIEARTASPPITLEAALALALKGGDPSYWRVRVDGRFRHDLERYLYAISDGKVGWHVVTPLATQSGTIVLVDRGFVPDELKDPSARPMGQVGEIVTVTGIVRASESRNLFTPDNEPQANRWFWRDLQGMARSMFPAGTAEVAPFFIEADKTPVPGGWPQGGQTRLELPNNHLQYALTWFLMAAAFLIIYGAYVRGLYRRRTPLE